MYRYMTVHVVAHAAGVFVGSHDDLLLQIHAGGGGDAGGGGGEHMYRGNKPIAPHPPSEPPTPRTPRTNIQPRFPTTTPRGAAHSGWETPRDGHDSPPLTARGGGGGLGVKRLPSYSDSNGDGAGGQHGGGGGAQQRHSKRQASATKRRKNEVRSPNQAQL